MPTFPGELSVSLYPERLVTVIPIVKYTERYFDPFDEDLALTGASISTPGQHTQVQASVEEAEHGGQIAHTFTADFYNRIHISPNPVNFGSLLEATTVTVEIWNAFFTETRWVDTVSTGFEGLEFGVGEYPPPDVVIPALGNYNLHVTGYTEGPANINAQVSFDMPGRYVQLLGITGRRSKLFPFVTSWEKNPVEGFEWKTNIVETEQWEEFRYRIREHPRRDFRLGMGAVAAGASDLRVALLSSQGSEYGLPLWMYETELAQSADAGHTTIYVKDTLNSDFQAGRPALIYLNTERFETVVVESVGDGELVLDPDRGVQQFWPADETKVYPIRITRMSDQISVDTVAPITATATVNLDATLPEDHFEGPDFPMYSGYPVLDWMPNWKSPRRITYRRKFDTVDNAIHVPEYHDLSLRFGEEQDFEWFLNGRHAVRRFKALMQYMAGRASPVWVPSWQDDMPKASDYVASSFYYVVGSNYASKFMQANITEPTHIRLLTIDGKQYYDRLESAGASAGNPAWDRLVLATGWGEDVPKLFVENCCRMVLARLASDRVEIEWYTPQMARAKTTFVYVPEQPQ